VPNVPYAQKSVWTHLIVHLRDVDQVEARFGLFEDSVSQDRCTVCTIGCPKGSKIILGTPDGTPR
jgi:hypothetical protein